MQELQSVLRQLESNRVELSDRLTNHQLFVEITNLPRLRLFMETHVFAVWDFMSLAKRIQQELTSCSLPWVPALDPLASRLINEIILGEETDIHPAGGYSSHFELYLAAMAEVGANTVPIKAFIKDMRSCDKLNWVAPLANLPEHIRSFVGRTLSIAIDGELEQVLGYFFYGREDLIPEMFRQILRNWNISPGEAPLLHYYLERHIQLDGEEHGPAAAKLLDRMVRSDSQRYQKLLESVCEALDSRIKLWNGVCLTFDALSS